MKGQQTLIKRLFFDRHVDCSLRFLGSGLPHQRVSSFGSLLPSAQDTWLSPADIQHLVLPARTPLELPSMEISLDIDSFSWSFTGQLWGASTIALVEPDKKGPKQIEVDINGWKWVFIIERYSTERRFGDERYTLYGSSRTQLLAAPYAPQRSQSNSANLNAKQAISEELALSLKRAALRQPIPI
ncbi:MAG: hypothetical protein LPH21_06165 [Shewanella sp.]|nr:hypothetical protein [Shewanella sp.]